MTGAHSWKHVREVRATRLDPVVSLSNVEIARVLSLIIIRKARGIAKLNYALKDKFNEPSGQ